MFVRWKRRRTKRWGGSLYAVLVENKREGGRVRQKVVKHLAHIHTGRLDCVADRVRFWERVEKRLAELGLPEEARAAVEGRLARVVPRPTPEEIARYEREMEALRAFVRPAFRC